MERGKAFLVVGHRQWGKSRTLKALTDDSHHARFLSIAKRHLFVRRMSNDDKPSDYRRVVSELRPTRHEFVILGFCPVFDKDADEILGELKEHYAIHSFVLRNSYDRARHISAQEIARLRAFGPVEVFDHHAESADRADALRAFIEHHLGCAAVMPANGAH